MVIRISLVLSGMIAGGAIFLSHTKLQEHINTTEENRVTAETERDNESEARTKVEGELAARKATLETTQADLADKQMQIASRISQIEDMNKTIARHETARRAAEGARDEVVASNPDWFALNTTAQKVRSQRDKLPKVEDELATTRVELGIIGRDNMRLKNTILKLKPQGAPDLPEGLAGKIIAYDPKYEYVVLNIGGNHGVLMDGELLATRGSDILGRVRVTRVEDDHSVANIMQEFREGELSEGDSVVYRSPNSSNEEGSN